VNAFEEWQFAEAVLADYVEEHRLLGALDGKERKETLSELQAIVEAARERVEHDGRSVSGSRFFGVMAGEPLHRLPDKTLVLAWPGEEIVGNSAMNGDPGQPISLIGGARGVVGKRWRSQMRI
jgi:hypothetical protein